MVSFSPVTLKRDNGSQQRWWEAHARFCFLPQVGGCENIMAFHSQGGGGRGGSLRSDRFPRITLWARDRRLRTRTCAFLSSSLPGSFSLYFSSLALWHHWDSNSCWEWTLLLLFTPSIMSDSLWPHELQHARLPCASVSQSLSKPISIESVMPSNQLILCLPFLLLPSIFPSITSWQIDGKTVTNFILGGSKITSDGDFSHEIKRCLLFGRKAMTNLDSMLKSRDITLPKKVRLVKAIFFQ